MYLSFWWWQEVLKLIFGFNDKCKSVQKKVIKKATSDKINNKNPLYT